AESFAPLRATVFFLALARVDFRFAMGLLYAGRWARTALQAPGTGAMQARRNAVLADDAEPDQADDNEVDRDDVVEEPGHQQDEDAGDQRDDGLQVRVAEEHRGS